MVYGTIYCPVSRLPIQDKEQCMFLPLDFSINTNLGTGLGVHNFTQPYEFVAIKPQVVIYNGNPSEVTFLEKSTSCGVSQMYKNELTMLVQKKFYDLAVKENPLREWFSTLESCRMYATGFGNLIKKIHEIEDHNRQIERILAFQPNHPCVSEKKEVPEWITDLACFSLLCRELGAMSPVSLTVDQIGRQYSFFETIRKKASE